DALRWLRSSGYSTPFILLTGTLGDEVAVECIKEGATDYVLKEKLDRLPRACRRALEEEHLRAQRDRAEKELRDSEEQYRLLFETNPLPMWVFDRETLAFLAVNEAAVRHYGFSRGDFFSMPIRDIRPQSDVPALLQVVSHPVEGLSSTDPWKHRKKDGTVIDVEITSHGLTFRGRDAELVLANDVTEQKRDQERLKQSEERFAKAFRSNPLAITITTRSDSRYLDVNEAFLKMAGYDREQVIGHTVDELDIWVEPADRADMVRHLDEFGSIADQRAKLRTRSRDVRLCDISAELIELDGMSCMLAIIDDITD